MPLLSLVLVLPGCLDRNIPILASSESCAPPREERVGAVVDGDTIDLETGERVRLLGIDAPELYHPDDPEQGCAGPDDGPCCYGEEAADWLRARLPAGWDVTLEFDIDCEDPYGRTLAYVYAAPSEGAEVEMLNQVMVEKGLARVYTEDVENAQEIRELEVLLYLEEQARSAGVGLWGACDG